MARPYKKRAIYPNSFKVCDLNKLREQCICSADNVCVCAALKGICSLKPSTDLPSFIRVTQPATLPHNDTIPTNGSLSVE